MDKKKKEDDAMKVTIKYCQQWNYLPRASSLGEELEEKLGAQVVLVAGSNGIFDVAVDDNMVFSKFERGRFPNDDEIINLIRENMRS